MKICFFDSYKLGVIKADGVVDVSDVVRDVPHLGPHDLINGVIERFGVLFLHAIDFGQMEVHLGRVGALLERVLQISNRLFMTLELEMEQAAMQGGRGQVGLKVQCPAIVAQRFLVLLEARIGQGTVEMRGCRARRRDDGSAAAVAAYRRSRRRHGLHLGRRRHAAIRESLRREDRGRHGDGSSHLACSGFRSAPSRSCLRAATAATARATS